MDFNYVILPTIHVYNMCIKFLNNWSQKQYGIFVRKKFAWKLLHVLQVPWIIPIPSKTGINMHLG